MVKLDPSISLWGFFSLIHLLEFGYGDVIAVPPLNINQKDLMKHLSLVDMEIDLPAIYVFGDSFVDNGNNKAILGNKDAIGGGYLPFGIDFDGKPTGRFTNGRTGVDFIGMTPNEEEAYVGICVCVQLISFYVFFYFLLQLQWQVCHTHHPLRVCPR